MIRLIIPTGLVPAPFWLTPKTLYVHASMTLPIFLPYVVFSHVLNKVWRRHRLRQHGLDPFLVELTHPPCVHRTLRPPGP